jgi:hypothetical protein
MIRLLSTFAGARRASLGGPIIRLLNDPEDAFIVGLPGSASIMAVDPATGRADGAVKVVDLMAGDLVSSPPVAAGDDQRQGVTEAGHAVLDIVDRERAPHVQAVDLLRKAEQYAGEALFGDRHCVTGRSLDERRALAVRAAAFLILAAEAIDAELEESEP